MTAPTSRWKIPPGIWAIMLSWGLAVLGIAGMLSAWIYHNQLQRDRDMCTMMSVFLSGPEPVPGPSGDRSRVVRAAMRDYYVKSHCPPR